MRTLKRAEFLAQSALYLLADRLRVPVALAVVHIVALVAVGVGFVAIKRERTECEIKLGRRELCRGFSEALVVAAKGVALLRISGERTAVAAMRPRTNEAAAVAPTRRFVDVSVSFLARSVSDSTSAWRPLLDICCTEHWALSAQICC